MLAKQVGDLGTPASNSGLAYLFGGIISGSVISFMLLTYLIKVNKTATKSRKAANFKSNARQDDCSSMVDATSNRNTSCDEEKYM
jgi:hypothetical protein